MTTTTTKKRTRKSSKAKAATDGDANPLIGLSKKVKNKKLQVNTDAGRGVILAALSAAVDGTKCEALSPEYVVAANRLIVQLKARQ